MSTQALDRIGHEMATGEEKFAIDWRTRFKKGDVVRSSDGEALGVVLHVGQYWDTPPRYELHVDMPEGVGIWEPWAAVLSNDPASVAEAKRLGLRGLDPEEEARYADERRQLLESPEAARARAEVLPRVLTKLTEFESRKDESLIRFKVGDMVRNSVTGELGVVWSVDWSDPPHYQLHVELPGKVLKVWPPEEAVVADDPESAKEINHLGLPKLAPREADSEY